MGTAVQNYCTIDELELKKEVFTMYDSILPIVKESDLRIIAELRKNSRQTLADISRKTRISISTIYDRIKFHENKLIKKHTCLVNFHFLGYNIRTNILLKANDKTALREFVGAHPNINSAFEINNDFNFILDCIFADMSEARDFIESLDKVDVEKKQVHYVVDELKSEEFMANM